MGMFSAVIADQNIKWAEEALKEMKKKYPTGSNFIAGAEIFYKKLKEKGVFSE